MSEVEAYPGIPKELAFSREEYSTQTTVRFAPPGSTLESDFLSSEGLGAPLVVGTETNDAEAISR